MKKAKLLKTPVFLILCVSLPGVGCTKFGKSRPTSSPGVEASTDGTSSPGRRGADGTSSSGGANGVDGKVYDSYIVDPTQLPAFKKYLSNAIRTGEDDPTSALLIGAHLRTWYIAPVDLQEIEKGVLGISFVKSGTQQIAIQTLNEIWIDKRIFDAMTEKEQADTIAHEIVMTLYFMKFVPFSKVCESALLQTERPPEGDCKKETAAIDELYPVEPTRGLTEADNQAIRRVTGWLLNRIEPGVTNKEFVNYLLANGFSQKMMVFGAAQDVPTEELKLSTQKLFDSLNASQLTGTMPDTCTGLQRKESKACKISFQPKSVKWGPSDLPGLEVRLKIDDREKIINSFFDVGNFTSLLRLPTEDGSQIYYQILTEANFEMKVGDQFLSAIVFFEKDPRLNDQLTLNSIIFKPGIVTSIAPPDCEARAPQASSLIDDQITARHSGSRALTFERVFLTSSPIMTCSSTETENADQE